MFTKAKIEYLGHFACEDGWNCQRLALDVDRWRHLQKRSMYGVCNNGLDRCTVTPLRPSQSYRSYLFLLEAKQKRLQHSGHIATKFASKTAREVSEGRCSASHHKNVLVCCHYVGQDANHGGVIARCKTWLIEELLQFVNYFLAILPFRGSLCTT